MSKVSVLRFLKNQLAGILPPKIQSHFPYPTVISGTIRLKVTAVELGRVTVEINAVPGKSSTAEGKELIYDLAQAAIGTAHSTVLWEDESYAALSFALSLHHPTWQVKLRATVRPLKAGREISHYICEIKNDDDIVVAIATSTMITLSERGFQ
jgi:hypothetical protein